MSDSITIAPPGRPVVGTIRPPGSKSLTNRALVCAALAGGRSSLTGALDSDDTRVMIDSLRRLGLVIDVANAGTTLRVQGNGGQFATDCADLFVGNSGTTIRFLTAMVALAEGRYTLDGIPRMRERPIGDLLDALNQLGTNAVSVENNGCPPVVVEGTGLIGGKAAVAGASSSQFLSGLLMAVPLAQGPVELIVEGNLVSRPYVEMTLAVMRAFGVEGSIAGDLSSFEFKGRQQYAACQYTVEPDASAASYFWAAAAITGGQVTVPGLTRDSLQGDVAFVDCLVQMGCNVQHEADAITVIGPRQLRGIDVDMSAISDTAQTLAAVAMFANGDTTIRGIGHNRLKETDRIGNLAIELRKLGATVEEFDDGFTISPRPAREARIECYDDHRMAMSLGLVGLRIAGVEILDPDCTAKTYPRYWHDLQQLITSR